MGDHQDVQDVQPAASQRNRTRNIQNRTQRLKWSKEMNQDVMRCYFATILREPTKPYKKQFHERWMLPHLETTISEQRICDQQRQIMKKINTRENTRGTMKVIIFEKKGKFPQNFKTTNDLELL